MDPATTIIADTPTTVDTDCIPTAKDLKSVRSKLYYYRKKLAEYNQDPELVKKKPYLYQKAVCKEAELVAQIHDMVSKRGGPGHRGLGCYDTGSSATPKNDVTPLDDRTVG